MVHGGVVGELNLVRTIGPHPPDLEVTTGLPTHEGYLLAVGGPRGFLVPVEGGELGLPEAVGVYPVDLGGPAT